MDGQTPPPSQQGPTVTSAAAANLNSGEKNKNLDNSYDTNSNDRTHNSGILEQHHSQISVETHEVTASCSHDGGHTSSDIEENTTGGIPTLNSRCNSPINGGINHPNNYQHSGNENQFGSAGQMYDRVWKNVKKRLLNSGKLKKKYKCFFFNEGYNIFSLHLQIYIIYDSTINAVQQTLYIESIASITSVFVLIESRHP